MNQIPLASSRHNGKPTADVLAAIDAIDAAAEERWMHRFDLYAISAERDRELYAWLEGIGQMPKPSEEVSGRLMRAWRAQCAAQHTAQHAAQPTHTNRATS